MWVAQCSLEFEVLQDGFEYVLELIFKNVWPSVELLELRFWSF